MIWFTCSETYNGMLLVSLKGPGPHLVALGLQNMWKRSEPRSLEQLSTFSTILDPTTQKLERQCRGEEQHGQVNRCMGDWPYDYCAVVRPCFVEKGKHGYVSLGWPPRFSP